MVNKEIFVNLNNYLVHFHFFQCVPSSIFSDQHTTHTLRKQFDVFCSFLPPPASPSNAGNLIPDIFIIEVIPINDIHNSDPIFLPAKKKEIQGLFQKEN